MESEQVSDNHGSRDSLFPTCHEKRKRGGGEKEMRVGENLLYIFSPFLLFQRFQSEPPHVGCYEFNVLLAGVPECIPA